MRYDFIKNHAGFMHITKKKKSFSWRLLVKYILIITAACVFVFPLFWMIASSIKTDNMIFADISSLKAFLPYNDGSSPFRNYIDVLARFPLLKSELNSLYYISIIIISSLMINSMAGYALAKLKVPYKKFILSLILALIIVPAQIIMLPLFSIIFRLGWANTYLGLIVPFLANPLFIFLFHQNYKSISSDIIEAACIDGAGAYLIFFRVVMPLVKPVYATVCILIFIEKWNDFIWPVMVITDTAKYTVQMAMSTLFSLRPLVYGQIMAGLTFILIPVLIIFLTMQKYYIQGIAGTGSKD